MASQRSIRLSKISNESGTFVYDGSSVAIEHIPTAIKIGKNEPVLDGEGMPVVDKNGDQVFQKSGKFKIGEDCRPVLGGVPKEVRVVLDSRKVMGIEFPKGKPVKVENAKIAQKLRCLQGFKEVEEIQIKEADLDTIEGLLTLSKKELIDLAEKKEIQIDGRLGKEEIAKAIISK